MIIGISGKISSGKDTIGKIIQYLVAENKHKALDHLSEYKDYTYTLQEFIQGSDIYNKVYTKDYTESITKDSGWQIKKFADKLKDIVCMLTGCTREQLEDQNFKNQLLPDHWQVFELYNFNKIVGHGSKVYGSTVTFNTETEAVEFCNSKSNSQHQYTYRKSERTYRWMLQYIGTDLFRDKLHLNTHVNALFSEYQCLDDTKRRSMGNVIDYSDCLFPSWIITDLRFPNEYQAIKDRTGIIIRVNRDQICEECGVKGGHKMIPHYKKEHESEIALDDHEFQYIIDNNGTIEELIEKVKEILIKENII